jgi:hypothetical protein
MPLSEKDRLMETVMFDQLTLQETLIGYMGGLGDILYQYKNYLTPSDQVYLQTAKEALQALIQIRKQRGDV